MLLTGPWSRIEEAGLGAVVGAEFSGEAVEEAKRGHRFLLAFGFVECRHGGSSVRQALWRRRTVHRCTIVKLPWTKKRGGAQAPPRRCGGDAEESNLGSSRSRPGPSTCVVDALFSPRALPVDRPDARPARTLSLRPAPGARAMQTDCYRASGLAIR